MEDAADAARVAAALLAAPEARFGSHESGPHEARPVPGAAATAAREKTYSEVKARLVDALAGAGRPARDRIAELAFDPPETLPRGEGDKFWGGLHEISPTVYEAYLRAFTLLRLTSSVPQGRAVAPGAVFPVLTYDLPGFGEEIAAQVEDAIEEGIRECERSGHFAPSETPVDACSVM